MSYFETDPAPKLMKEIELSIETKKRVLQESMPVISEITKIIKSGLGNGNKLLLFGNGGSAADSQHIAAEFVSKFNLDRNPLPAIALTTDSSILTSVSNDYSFHLVFSRQVEGLGRPGDVAIGISTSGNSPNVIKGIEKAREMGLVTIGFTGRHGGQLKDVADYCFRVPSESTARIQEVHITVAHAICGVVEAALCSDSIMV